MEPGKDNKIIITIDGFSSCGKSTLAKELANRLHYVFIDSGAMYRAITLYFLRHHIDWNTKSEVNEALLKITLQFKFTPDTENFEIFLNGENVEWLIRDMVVAENVSEVAAIREVREFAVAQQQKMGDEKGIVMDGRDIGTTVFPNAELKIFLTADPAVRTERRYKELILKNPHTTLEEVRSNLEMRDKIDSTREISPLRKADDAIVIDNSELSVLDQLKLVMDLVEQKIATKSQAL